MTPAAGTDPLVVQVVPLLKVRSLGREAFDYLIAAEHAPGAHVGTIVRMPFGRRSVNGVVVAVGGSGEVAASKLRFAVPAPHHLDESSLILARTMSDHYLAPLGACLQAVIPAHHLAPRELRPAPTVAWVVPPKGPQAGGSKPGARVALSPGPRDAPTLTALQRGTLDRVPPEGLPVTKLCGLAGVSRSVVNTLVARGLLEKEARLSLEAAENPVPENSSAELAEGPEDPPLQLSEEQDEALSALRRALGSRRCGERLLWGVTGSGKTEVYLRLLDDVLADGDGAIVLVPEIALTVRLASRLRARFGDRVAVLHSGLSPARRAREYDRAARGEAQVVVGARSAVFTPVPRLRLVVIDEAHDSSYKQDDEPRYDARWVARRLVERCNGLLVEGTATPGCEILHRSGTPLELTRRPAGVVLPDVEVIDMRRQSGSSVLAPLAAAALRQTLQAGRQAVVLLNRRGYASYLLCEGCGHVVMCPQCEVSLTYHRSTRALMCHSCGLRTPVPGICPACDSAALRRGAPGTERVVDELMRVTPRENLFRLDSDVVTSGTRVSQILDRFASTTPAVLVGTQMVAKGHDFPLVTLVVVVDADTGLYLPDFRAGERTYQLLTQVAGRAGRAEHPGRVLVQTWNPDVPCIRMSIARDRHGFYREELLAREALGYPPYRDLIRLVVSGSAEGKVEAGGEYLAEKLRSKLEDVRGPARVPRVRGRERRQIVVADPRSERAHRVVARALEKYRGPYVSRGLDILVDVDPLWFA